MIDWYIEGVEFASCNCGYGCPCQFEDKPTHGHCRGFEVLRIDKGRFGETSLDGLACGITYAWPGPVYEGKGEMQVIIDERADAAQRAALETVLKGGETQEARTHWWVYHAMSDRIHPTLFKPIDFSCDIEARTARVVIPGVLEFDRTADSQPGNRRAAPGTDRYPAGDRIRTRRDRQRHDQGHRRRAPRLVRQLRSVQPAAALR